MDDFRQQVVDAAVRELRHQLGDDSVDAHGTLVQVDGSFKMARVCEYVLRTALDSRDERIIEEVAKGIARDGRDWEEFRDQAIDAITSMFGIVTALMDPST
ncbi:hypothetical protein N5J77_27790 [Sphingobium yanoikuyae]|uniref:Uncharacterized protein n=1 Tax=Sphingobium yanoikuyae TaxID=13690 RepID=A0AA43BEU7_SPHYA|nr:hypothetical protein [Sphingobium yanoikuyae]MDH2134939.1 hypothetical protein [Sphingobium yanoikuyae]MDH2152792.1 hypothetical protein [Sphingobium yanoikuyae]MDH2170254.1 hypothetical protein [Sphingobium yanoikuyae]